MSHRMTNIGFIFFMLGVVVIPSPSYAAASCATIFPNTVQGNGGASEVIFEDSGQIIGGLDNALPFPNIDDQTAGSHNTCTTADCTITGSAASALSTPSFQTTSTTTDVTENSGATTIGPGGTYPITEVDELTLSGSADVTFLASASTYKITDAEFSGNAQITFNPGEYWFDSLKIEDSVQVIINGPVTIYVNQKLEIKDSSQINVGGSAQDLAFFAYDEVKLKDDVAVKAVIYSVGSEVELEDNAQFTGAISTSGELKLKDDSSVTYENVSNVQVGSLCGGTPVVIDHFEIDHDGSGTTCAAESITIRACLDASCTSLSPDSISLDLQGDGVTRNTLTVTGSAVTSLSHTVAETLTLSIANSGATISNPLVCDSGSGTSCDITFSSSGCSSSCSVYFPGTVQGNSASSELRFEDSGQILGDPTNILQFQNLSDSTSGAHNTCATLDCSISGTQATALVPPVFQTSGTSSDVITSSGVSTIGPSGTFPLTEIDRLRITGTADVTFSAAASSYVISDASFQDNAQVTFNPGEYWFDSLEILNSTQIFINGPVIIYVNQHFDIEGSAQVNVSGAAQDLVFFPYDKMHMKDNVVVNAVIYSVGQEVKLEDNTQFTGAISASGVVELKDNSSIVYESVAGVQIGSLCGPVVVTIDHFEIIHDGAGLTCEAESITVRACADGACSSLSTDSVDIDFQANGVTRSSVTFTGSTLVSLSQTTPATLTLSIANPSIAPSGSVVCTGASCDIIFSDAGFRFLYGAANSTTVANQVAGDSFADSLKLQAVKDLNGVCTGLFTGNVTVDLAQQSISPSAVSSLDFTINGAAIAKNPGSGVSAYSATVLNFGADSTATIPLPLYEDAGQIQLHANYDAGGVSLVGSSNPLWVSPATLTVSAQLSGVDLNATGSAAGPVQKAGANFDLVVFARNSTGVVTPNYLPTQIQFKLQRTGPITGGTDGDFAYAAGSSMASAVSPVFQDVVLTPFSAGISTFNQASYSEVGLLNLDLQETNYGGVGIVVAGSAVDIGRFTPDHFLVAVQLAGSLQAGCTAAGDYSYVGESVGYLVAPSITITPVDTSGVGITENYRGSFMHLTAGEVSVSYPAADATNGLAVSATPTTGSLTENGDGTLEYTLGLLDTYVYNRAGVTEIVPFVSDLDILVTAVSESLDSVSATGLPVTVEPTGSQMRFGRLRVDNAFGSEAEPLPVPVVTEYFAATGRYETNLDDFCSSPFSVLSTTPDSVPSGSYSNIPVSSGASTMSFNNPVLAGDGGAIFSAPGAGNTGDINMTFNLGSLDWLQFDWDGDGSPDTSLTRTVTFGQYRGHDRVIFWEEVLN